MSHALQALLRPLGVEASSRPRSGPDAGSARWRVLEHELDLWPAASAVFWWRDDDATASTPALTRLLALRQQVDVPLALSVIPADIDDSLKAVIDCEPRVAILQHGWDHTDYGRPGRYKAELAETRGAAEVLAQLRAGQAQISRTFGDRALPVLAPPFAYLARHLVPIVREAGFRHVSVYGDFALRSLSSRNVHADLIDWRTEVAISSAKIVRSLVSALRLRRFGLVGRHSPIGINTHHLNHDEEVWQLNESLLTLLRRHRAVSFAPLERIFQ